MLVDEEGCFFSSGARALFWVLKKATLPDGDDHETYARLRGALPHALPLQGPSFVAILLDTLSLQAMAQRWISAHP